MGNSPRPGVWALERSTDNGKTYMPWQYFADTVRYTPNQSLCFFKVVHNLITFFGILIFAVIASTSLDRKQSNQSQEMIQSLVRHNFPK